MSDINANIGVNINTSEALAQLKALQREIANFHASIVRTTAASIASQKNLESNLLNSINATGKFTAQMGTIRSSTDSFTHALETNKLSMREYFRFAGGATQTFGKLFKTEFDTIGKVAEERVKTLQTQYIKMGRDANGAIKAMSIRPTTLNLQDYTTKAMVAAQKQALFNELLSKGSTNLLNFGKNTQWAGRQLMVGFTVPLTMFGTQAAKVFMDLEMAAISFKRVYGDMFTSADDTNKALANVQAIAKGFTQYGVAVKDVISTASDIAAMGKTGVDLTNQLTSAVKLSVLGQIDQKTALETTISLTNSFGIAADQLGNKINFLNAVENQTVLSLQDVTTAIPKVAPVVKQLGGSVEDLTYFMTAMREGGINASEGANALKSALASMINPTKASVSMLAGFGINIKGIVQNNAGNLKGTVLGIAQALDTLAPLDRAKAIETMFGKFQFARVSALFQNITKDGSQANKVLQLTQASVEELAILSQREMNTVKDAVTTKFKAAFQQFQLSIAPIGKEFLKAVTPILQVVTRLFDKFNNLSDGTKKFITQAALIGGVIGPVALMTFGLLANSLANIIKLFLALKNGFNRLGSDSQTLGLQTKYLKTEQLEAATVAASLNQAHVRLTQNFEFETAAVIALRNAYIAANAAAGAFTIANPGMVKRKVAGKYATGTTGLPGPAGAGDIIPIMAAPGEAIIPARVAQNPENRPLISALVNNGKLPGFEKGTVNVGGKDYPVTKQSNAESLKKKIRELELAGISEKSIVARLDDLLSRDGTGKYITATKLERNFRASGGRPGWVDKGLTQLEQAHNLESAMKEKEAQAIVKALKLEGITDPAKIKNAVQQQASHIFPIYDENGNKITDERKWQHGQVFKDVGAVNNYLNRASGKNFQSEIRRLIEDPELSRRLGFTSEKVTEIKKDLQFALSQKQPTSFEEFKSVARLAELDTSLKDFYTKQSNLSKGAYQASAVSAVASVRDKSWYTNLKSRVLELNKDKIVRAALELETAPTRLGNGPATKDEIVAVNKKTEVKKKKNGQIEEFTNKNSTPKPKSVKTNNSTDDTLTRLNAGDSVVKKPPRVRGLADAPYLNPYAGMDPQFASEQKSLRRQSELLEKRKQQAIAASIKAEQDAIRAKELEIKLQQERSAKMRDSYDKFSSGTRKVAGALSGLTIASTFAGGKFAEMGQKVLPLIIGLDAVSMVLPKLPQMLQKVSSPLGMAAVTITALVTATTLLNKAVGDARTSVLEMRKTTDVTTENLNSLSEFAGTVSASAQLRYRQEQSKKPLTAQPGTNTFGESYMGSDSAKSMAAGLRSQMASGNTAGAMKSLQTQLQTSILSGVLTKAQAKSIALNMGQELNNTSFGIKVAGNLDTLMGPNGDDVLKSGLDVNIRAKMLETQTQNIGKSALTAQRAGGGMQAGSMNRTQALGVGGALGMVAYGAIAGSAATPIGALVGTLVGVGVAFATIRGQAKQIAAATAASVATQKQGLTIADEMSASLQINYEKAIATAKANGDIAKAKALEAEYTRKSAVLDQKRLDLSNSILKTYDKSRGQTQAGLVAAAKESVTSKWKGTDQEAFTKTAIDATKRVSGRAEYILDIQMASGSMTPQQVMGITDVIGKNEKRKTQVVDIIAKFGGDTAGKAADVLQGFYDENGKLNQKAAGKFLLSVDTAKSSEEANKIINLMQMITSVGGVLKGKLLIDYYSGNSDAQKKLQDILDKFSKEKNITAKIAVGIDPKLEGTFDPALFDKLTSNEKQTYLNVVESIMQVDQKVLMADGDFKTWQKEHGFTSDGKSKGGSVANQQKLYAKETANKAVKSSVDVSVASGGPVDPNAGKVGGTKTDPYAFLSGAAKSARDFKNAGIDAIKPLNALQQILKGKMNLDSFNGLSQKLANIKSTALKGGKGSGMSEGFMESLLGLDPAAFKKLEGKLYTIKNGIISLTPKGKAANKLFDMAAISESMGAMQKSTRETINQVSAYDKLKKSGLDSATAMKIAGDAAMASAIAGGRINLATPEWQKYKKAIDAATEANKKFASANMIDELTRQVEAIQNQKTAYEKLKAAGIDEARAVEVAKNETYAFVIANEKVDGANWPVLIDLIKKTKGELNGATSALEQFINDLKGDIQFKADFSKIIPQLKAMGATVEDIQTLLDKPDVAKEIIAGLKDGTLSAQRLKEMIDLAAMDRTININFNMVANPQEAINNQINDLVAGIDSQINAIDAQMAVVHSQFDPLIAGAQVAVDAAQASIDSINAVYDAQINAIQASIDQQQHAIQQMFDKPIAAFQDQIAALQKQMADTIDKPIAALNEKIAAIQHQIDIQFTRPLAALSEESNILSNNLTILNHQEQAINDKYDKQIAALEQVNKINQDISNQKKSQLSIADALSKGDIAAAAKAIEEMRAQNAASAGQSAVDAMNAARKGEIGGLTVNGMTKAQIEERQYQIQQEQFKLQQQQLAYDKQIQVLQDQIYQIELGRKAIQDQITAIEEKIAALEAQKKIALEAIAAQEEQIYQLKQQQNAELKIANETLVQKQKELKTIEDQMNAQLKPLEDQKIKWEEIKTKLLAQQAELNKIPLTLEDAKTKAGELAGKIANIGQAAAEAAAQIAAMVAQIAAAQAAAAASAASSVLSPELGAGIAGNGAYGSTTTADAQAALIKLTSGQTLTDAEKALLGLSVTYQAPHGAIDPTLLASGGIVPEYFDLGGVAGMFKKRGTDTVPAMLTPGEFVINRKSTKKFRPILDKINKGEHPHGKEFGRSHNKGEHEGWDKEHGDKPKLVVDPPIDGFKETKRTGSTRGGEARSWDPGFRGVVGDSQAPSFANGSVGDGMMYAGGNPNFNEAGGGQGSTGTGPGSGNAGGAGGSGKSSSQELSTKQQLLAIEKQIQAVLQAIAALEEQISNAMSLQLQIQQQVQAIFTKLPQLATQLVTQLKLEKEVATAILELLKKEQTIYDSMLLSEIQINAQKKIHKDFVVYLLDKTTGYPKMFDWMNQIWLKIKDGINPQLDLSITKFKDIVKQNETLYNAINKELVNALQLADKSANTLLTTVKGIASAAQAALAAIKALNTTVTTIHIIKEICIPCDAAGAGGAATGGQIAANALPAGNGGGATTIGMTYAASGGIIPKYMATGGSSATFQPIGTDTVPTMLTPGEFVINARSAKNSLGLLQGINSGNISADTLATSAKMPTFTRSPRSIERLSGPTYSKSNLPRQASSGMQTAGNKISTSISDNSAVYNYSVNINVSGSEASNPNEIANVVMQRIKQIESQQIRKQVSR